MQNKFGVEVEEEMWNDKRIHTIQNREYVDMIKHYYSELPKQKQKEDK